MATPLGNTFVTDEQIVAQDDILRNGKMVESLVVEFDHLPLMVDVILRLICSSVTNVVPSGVAISCMTRKRRRQELLVKVFLESNEKDYNKNCSFRLQGRENIES